MNRMRPSSSDGPYPWSSRLLAAIIVGGIAAGAGLAVLTHKAERVRDLDKAVKQSYVDSVAQMPKSEILKAYRAVATDLDKATCEDVATVAKDIGNTIHSESQVTPKDEVKILTDKLAGYSITDIFIGKGCTIDSDK